jgi:sporulation protein YlmC with PRC-barrel domain
MVMAHLDVGEEVGAVTELLIDITYDKTTHALLLPQEDLDYLQSIGTISSVTLSYVQKVSK